METYRKCSKMGGNIGIFNSGNNEEKQRKKQTEKILNQTVRGLMPTVQEGFFQLNG